MEILAALATLAVTAAQVGGQYATAAELAEAERQRVEQARIAAEVAAQQAELEREKRVMLLVAVGALVALGLTTIIAIG